jgi:threonine dehydrogenase-like Zn-dependent dehydrogenase
VDETPTPDPGPGQVLVRVLACGVCASELELWAGGRPHYPHRLGHEPMGSGAAVGAGVERLRQGDRVTGLVTAAHADHCLAAETDLLPVPDGVAEEAALGEPLACLGNAQRRTPVELADRVAVVGLGYMGLGMLQLLKLRGPSRIVLGALVTHRYPLEEVDRAFADLEQKPPGFIKAVVRP